MEVYRVIMKFKNAFRNEYLIVILISFLAIGLRLWGLSSKEFWYDEAYTGILANASSSQFVNLLQFDVHPPVYISLLRVWLFFLGSNDFTIRLFSVLAGALLVPISYLLAKNLQITQKYPSFRFIIPIVFAVNPFFVEYSKEARSYALSVLVFSLLFLSCYIAQKYTKFNTKWLITALLTSLALLTHYLIIFGIIFLYLFDFLYANKQNLPIKKYICQKLQLYLIMFPISLLLIVWFIPIVLIQYKNAPQLWWIPTVSFQQLPSTLYKFLFGVKTNNLGVPPALQLFSTLTPDVVGFVIFSVVLFAIGYLLTKKSFEVGKKDLNMLIFCSIGPIVTIIFLQLFNNRLFLERYLISYGYIWIILCLVPLLTLNKILKYSIVSLYIATSIYLILNINYDAQGFAKFAKALEKIQAKEVLVILPDPITFTVAKYYLANNSHVSVRLYDPKEDLDDWEMISKTDILENYVGLKGKQRIFVYNNSKAPNIWYVQSAQIGHLYVYSTLPIFGQNLALNKLR